MESKNVHLDTRLRDKVILKFGTQSDIEKLREQLPEVDQLDDASIITIIDYCFAKHNRDAILNILLAWNSEGVPKYILSRIKGLSDAESLIFYSHPTLKKYFKYDAKAHPFIVAVRMGDVWAVEHYLAGDNPPFIDACEGHPPALVIAAFFLELDVVVRLVAAGADPNLEYEGKTAATRAVIDGDFKIVVAILSSPKFDFSKNPRLFKEARWNVKTSKQDDDATKIFRLLLAKLLATGNRDLINQVLGGETVLTYAIKLNRYLADQLIEEGVGVFDVDANGTSALSCARLQRDQAVVEKLVTYYKTHVSTIADLFLSADPRIFKKMPGQSSCVLVPSLVNEWLSLKQDLCDELVNRVNNSTITCAQLRSIRDQIKDPKSPLMQFFDIGHGSWPWQSSSPWPAKFAPMLITISEKLISANRFVRKEKNEDEAAALQFQSNK